MAMHRAIQMRAKDKSWKITKQKQVTSDKWSFT